MLSLAALVSLNRFTDSQTNLMITGLAIILFLWLYIRTSRSFRTEASARLERLQRSLELYCRASGILAEEVGAAPTGGKDPDHLILLLQECKAAPLITSNLLEMIDAYIRDRDLPRLLLVQRVLNREIDKRIDEQAAIIRTLDNPGWGSSFWRLLRPAVPFATLAFILYWSLQIYDGFHGNVVLTMSWASLELWSRYLSCLAATLSLYLVIMDTRKDSPGYLYRLLSLLIFAAAFFLFIGLKAAPYILAAQIILFLCGFKLNNKRSRRERPYAGHQDLLEDRDPLVKSASPKDDENHI